MTRNKGEQKFIHEYTRTLLIKWAHQTIAFGQMNDPVPSDKQYAEYLAYAQTKKWVTTKEPLRVTSAGMVSAANRLKA
jgi:hypothetical protein